MSAPTMPSLSVTRPLPVRWPRVGALSTSLSLHGVAGALFLLALSAPQVQVVAERTSPPTLSVTVVEPPPLPVPLPPTLPLPGPVAPPAPVARIGLAPIPAPARSEPVTPATSLPPSAVAVPVAQSAAAPDTAATASARVDYGSVSRPLYPGAALLRGIQGEVLVRVRVGLDGRPDRIELGRSSGNRDLDRAALAAVRGWRFRPARQSGQPVAAWVMVPVAFRLDRR